MKIVITGFPGRCLFDKSIRKESFPDEIKYPFAFLLTRQRPVRPHLLFLSLVDVHCAHCAWAMFPITI